MENSIFNNRIIVAKISLHYESKPTFIFWDITREKFANKLQDRKTGKEDTNWYYKRISYGRAVEISESESRNQAKKEYSEAIQKKYNVGPDWKENRWFIEQVRPTL